MLCCHILKVFDALAVREVPDRYILPRWSVEPVVDSGVEVAANEPLQEAQITDHGKHVIRYSRMCTNFNKIVRPFMAEDEGYAIVSKQVSALQSKLVALGKRRASSVLSGLECEQVDIEQPAAPRPQNKSRKKTSSSTGGGGDPNLSQQPNGSHVAGAEIGDPPITKKQGRPRSKRYKTGLGLLTPKNHHVDIVVQQNIPHRLAPPSRQESKQKNSRINH